MTDPRNWSEVAAGARSRAGQLPYGQRESGLKEIARSLAGVEWSTQTLRRSLAALEATERIEEEAGIPSASLRTFPLAAVECAARYFRRDPEQARIALAQLVNGKMTVAQLKRLDSEARPLDREIGRGLKVRFRSSVQSSVLAALGKMTGERLIANPLVSDVRKGLRDGGPDPLVIPDFVSDDVRAGAVGPPYAPANRLRCAALVVGPYRDPDAYQARSFEWVAKAMALAAVFRHRVLVLPGDCPESSYAAWRAMLRAGDDLTIFRMSDAHRWRSGA